MEPFVGCVTERNVLGHHENMIILWFYKLYFLGGITRADGFRLCRSGNKAPDKICIYNLEGLPNKKTSIFDWVVRAENLATTSELFGSHYGNWINYFLEVPET